MPLSLQFIVLLCGVVLAPLLLLEVWLWRRSARRARVVKRESLHVMRELDPYNHVILQQTADGDWRLRPLTGFSSLQKSGGEPPERV